jgi:hypothetical protein
MLPRALLPQPTGQSREANLSTGEGQRTATQKEDGSYSSLSHITSAFVRLLLVNGKLLEVIQRYLVQCFLVCSVEEDPACC